MSLKGSEKFVANAIQNHFSKTSSSVTYREGGNPPDIYLSMKGVEYPIEISDVDENTLINNKGTTNGYFSYLKELEQKVGSFVPDELVLFICFYHFNAKVKSIKKEFTSYLSNLVKTIKLGDTHEKHIGKVCIKIRALNISTARKVQGTVSSYGMIYKKSRDMGAVVELLGNINIDINTSKLLEERIDTKNKKCNHIPKPIWLALNDRYYEIFTDFNDHYHLEHYTKLLKMVADFKGFEKILIAFKNGDVLEYDP